MRTQLNLCLRRGMDLVSGPQRSVARAAWRFLLRKTSMVKLFRGGRIQVVECLVSRSD